jgi:hypothetical protein
MPRLVATSALLAAGVVLLPACRKEETVVQPALGATCEARPATGTAPLTVGFLLSVTGAEGPYQVSLSYGDGQSGTDPDQPHTYASAGAFTVSFDLKTATQTARCATTVSVAGGPTPPPTEQNQEPYAIFKSTPDAVKGTITGKAPLAVRFNMCASTDAEDDPLYFWMDLDGDGKWDVRGGTGASCRHDTTYAAGTWDARLCLTDVDAAGMALHKEQCLTFEVVATP